MSNFAIVEMLLFKCLITRLITSFGTSQKNMMDASIVVSLHQIATSFSFSSTLLTVN